MKIIQLTAENVKRLKAVTIRPDGNTVVISGPNGAGKTSVLDAIMFALGGQRKIQADPVRRGESQAHVRVDLGDVVVERRWGKGGSKLHVTAKDGTAVKSPQAVLDSLVGRLSFDPLEFLRKDSSEQLDIVRELSGLDTSDLDAEHDRVYAERTALGRQLKEAENILSSMPFHEDAPAEEVSTSALMAELERRQEVNRRNRKARDETAEASQDVEQGRQRVANLRAQLDAAMEDLAAAERYAASVAAKADGLQDEDEQEIRAQLRGAGEANRKHREAVARTKQAAVVDDLRSRHAQSHVKIQDLASARKRRIADAKYPIPGLGVSSGGVTFRNADGDALPLEQASTAEQIRISVAIGLALNPTLRVLLIRDASVLDETSLGLVAKMAEEKDAQLWLERIERGGATVVIEDGMVAS